LHDGMGMSSRTTVTLLLGLLGGCALDGGDGASPDPGESSDLDPGAPSTPPSTGTQAGQLLKEWSGCMSLGNFTSANMAPTWSAILDSSGSQCTSCHVPATLEFPPSRDAAAFFQQISEHSRSLLDFFTVDARSNPTKVIADPLPFVATGTGVDPHRQHPRFAVPEAALTALTTFYDATVARKASGTCDPPRLKD